MNHAHSEFIEIEAKSEQVLRLKVAAKSAAGWITDGDIVEVTDYLPSGKAVRRYAQAMCRPEPIRINWALR